MCQLEFIATAQEFTWGDANLDSAYDLGDAISTLSYLFASALSRRRRRTADGAIDIPDGGFTLSHLFVLAWVSAVLTSWAKRSSSAGHQSTPEVVQPCSRCVVCGTLGVGLLRAVFLHAGWDPGRIASLRQMRCALRRRRTPRDGGCTGSGNENYPGRGAERRVVLNYA